MTSSEANAFSSSTNPTVVSGGENHNNNNNHYNQEWRKHRQRYDIPIYDNNNKENENENENEESSFAFGVIADVQWADVDDGSNYSGTVKRCYRGAFDTLVRAVDWWQDYNQHQQNDNKNNNINSRIRFIAQLGDLIDGLNAQSGQSDHTLRLALEELARLEDCPSVNLIANHELYNFDRQQLVEQIQNNSQGQQQQWLQDGDQEYYSFQPTKKGWRVIVLDPYQLSVIGHSSDDPRKIRASEWLTTENPNVSPDGANGSNWFDGIEGYQRRFCPYNGGFGDEQLDWLEQELKKAVEQQERVMVLSHVILHPEACGGGTMAWDYEQALKLLQTASDGTNSVVAAVLCGHDHKGNYFCDDFGIHHCTFQSPLNKGTDGWAFGRIHVNDDGMEIVGPKLDDLLPDIPRRPAIDIHDDNGQQHESVHFSFRPMSWTNTA